MAGVKGRSGGYREGAGRKPAEQPPIALQDGDDPLEFLQKVWRGLVEPTDMQLKAAIEACRYKHKKPGAEGKKEQQRERASVIAGKFGRLRSVE